MAEVVESASGAAAIALGKAAAVTVNA